MTGPALVEQFPNVEDALLEILDDLGDVVTATGPDLTSTIQVLRVGGNANGYEDRAIVEVTTFAELRADSVRITNAVRERLNNLRNRQTAAGLIDKIREEEGPIQVPYLNPDTRRVPTYWRVIARKQPLPA